MRWLAGVVAALGLWFLHPGTAQALSCVPPEEVVAGADRAFIGTLVSRDGALLTFHVTEQIRGGLPDAIVVVDELAGAGWGLAAPPGTEIGLVVRDRAGTFTASTCDLAPPNLLRRAKLEPAPPLRTYPPLSQQPWWRDPSPPPPPPVDILPARRATAAGGWADLWLGCSVACSGGITLRARGGALLGSGEFALGDRGGVVSARLTREGRRRLRRDPRLQVRITVRVEPGSRTVGYGGSLILRRR